ncbi:hypothetical protein SAMN04515674_103238 [Pseudarcicella hirudinis]|uniref:Uncharacterized protein n=1 Tax=Pseudarcicella hirudinis TaxID=1079859 RepID=A0A1I5QKH2_9BACT|nr:hypothetical protein [Pseudarcicella hirudinis]SFP46531.1 hypothetical protein SAMN04515674_103238 [Pseudarcicella hirudinis]
MTPKSTPPKKASDRKLELFKEAQEYKKAIDSQVNELKTETFQVGKTTLIIGGVLAGAYLLFNLFVKDDKKSKKQKIVIDENSNLPVVVSEEPANDSWIVSSIKGYILAFLMSIAKEKILQAFTHLNEDNAEKVNT